MAKEETPSYINYGEQENASYEGKHLIAYFKASMKEYSISWLPTVKDSSLAKRMVKEYGDSVEDMVDKWVVMVKPYERAKFNFFYMKRHELAEVTQKLDEKDYGWD